MSDDDEAVCAEIGPEGIAKAISDKSRTFYIGNMGRLGFQVFCAFVEYTYFHPRFGPNSNGDFHYYAVHFGMPHFMISIPREYERRANKIAIRLKLKPQFGLAPLMIETGKSGGVKEFPGAREGVRGRTNIYTIESEDRTIYNNDRDLNRLIQSREMEIVDKLMLEGPVITPKQAADMLWRRD